MINGTKAFITNSGTDITALVTVDRGDRRSRTARKEISTIIVPSGTPGFTVSPEYSKVGWYASDTHELAFDDVPGAGGQPARRARPRLRPVPAILDEGRIAIAALAIGLAQGCVDESVQYAEASGTRSASRSAPYQAIQFKIADMEARAHTARLAYYDAAARHARRRAVQAAGGDREAATPARPRSTNAREATQIHGGYGFMNEFPVARHLAGREDPGDRRGHLRGAAHAHRPRPRPRLSCLPAG